MPPPTFVLLSSSDLADQTHTRDVSQLLLVPRDPSRCQLHPTRPRLRKQSSLPPSHLQCQRQENPLLRANPSDLSKKVTLLTWTGAGKELQVLLRG